MLGFHTSLLLMYNKKKHRRLHLALVDMRIGKKGRKIVVDGDH